MKTSHINAKTQRSQKNNTEFFNRFPGKSMGRFKALRSLRLCGKLLFFILAVPILFLSLNGCGSKTVPDWQNNSFKYMEYFKKYFLTGNERKSEIYFTKAVEEIKKSGDLNILAKAHLTKCAVRVATLEEIDCNEFNVIEGIGGNRENNNFYTFLKGNFDNVDGILLPERYQKFFKSIKTDTIEDRNSEIVKIEDPLSRLVTVGLSVKHGRYNESTLKTALDVASAQGWKKALLAYLEEIKSFYQKTREAAKADKVQQKINLIQNTE